jgi:hypothetical protein
MPVSWASKDASEVRSYSYSWSGRLNGAEINTATLVVKCGTVTLSNVANTINSISATVSGGAECESVELLSTITTTDAIPQTLEETITLTVEPSRYLNLGPSTSTKRDLVSMAYEEASLSGYEFDVTPEELFTGLRKLDANMAQDRLQSIDLNYNAPATFGGGDLEDYSGIPDAAITYASIKLAQAIYPQMGKSMSPETKARWSEAKAAVRVLCKKIVPMNYAWGTPKGAGNRIWNGWSPYLPTGYNSGYYRR